MEGDGIGMVLIRATELRSKITNCIDNATSPRKQCQQPNNASAVSVSSTPEHEANGKEFSGSQINEVGEADPEVEDDDEETESLFNIRDAFDTLESQLSALQALQQQQTYEREAALAEIDCSRKMLLTKLKEYRGEDLQVIHEASAFASESVKPNDDLLLPPYPTRPPRSLLMDNGFLSNFSTSKSQNGVINGDSAHESKNSLSGSRKNQMQQSRSSWKRFGLFLSTTTKMVVTLVGVISVLSLAGFKPRVRKRTTTPKLLGLFQQPATDGERSVAQCPPGKVLVVEDGESRCLVKERVEIPFESVVATPDVNYGCG